MVGAELLKLLGTLQVLCMCCAPRQGGTGRRVICAVLMYHTWVVLIVISQRMALSRNIACLVGSYINVLCFLPFFNFFFSYSIEKCYPEVHLQANKGLASRLESHFFKKLELPPWCFCSALCHCL